MENNNVEASNKGLASLDLFNIAFVVSDMDRTIEWYSDVLGFELVMKQAIPVENGELVMAFMQGAGVKIELLQNSDGQVVDAMVQDSKLDAPPTVVGSKAIVFVVDDVKLATAELEAKGVDFLWKERYLADNALLCTMVLDPDGNRINIFQRDTVG